MIDYIYLILITLLAYMSFQDFKWREVNLQSQFFMFFLLGIFMLILYKMADYRNLMFSIMGFVFFIGYGYVAYRFFGFGGADAKIMAMLTGFLPNTWWLFGLLLGVSFWIIGTFFQKRRNIPLVPIMAMCWLLVFIATETFLRGTYFFVE